MSLLTRAAAVAFIAASMALCASKVESEIKTALNIQVEAWNNGDLSTFVSTYASDCTFVGKEISHGRDGLLAHYKKSYPTREAMGHLTFNSLQVNVLDSDVATVIGEWRVDREAQGSSIAGFFSLVFRRQSGEWKIILDHTS